MKKVNAILCGDIHLREDIPICRTDKDFLDKQFGKLDFISELQERYNCPVFCSGDLFHHWKASPWLISKTIEHLPNDFYTVFGQHDLPNHSLKLKHKSSIYTLWTAGKLNILPGCHWGMNPNDIKRTMGFGNYDRRILVWHNYTYKLKPPFPGITSPKARSILHKYPQFDLIVTGDNHIPFTQKYKGRLLVNVGSMMRQDADQINYHPAVWLYELETNTVKKVYLPIDENAVSREHLEEIKERDNRIDAFISKFNTEEEVDTILDFEQNIKKFLKRNTVHKKTKQIILKSIDNDRE